MLGLFGAGIASTVGYYSAARFKDIKDERLRYTLLPAIVSLIAYNYLALNLPGSESLVTTLGGLSVFVIVLIGGALGLLSAHLWSRVISP